MSPTNVLDRRRFLAQAGTLAAVAATAGRAASGEDQAGAIPIIDTHQHLWDLRKFRLPWLESAPTLKRNFLPEDYRRATEGLGVVKAVYMEVDVDPSQQVEEAEDVVALCRSGKTPTVAAVISGRPASDGFKAYLARFKAMPEIKGVRQVLHAKQTPPGYCLEPAFVRGIRALGEAGLMFDLCMRAADLPQGRKLVEACPGTRFILDHCGNASVLDRDRSAWKADIAAVAKCDRVVCKVSGIVASTRGRQWTPDDLAPIVNHVLDVFGPDRVMFGGDWPVCTLGATYAQWVSALRTIVRDRPVSEQRKLFHDNAVRVYNLARS
jgi:predicted TIM-barrel fold metal-dependent hydrolase